MAQPTTVVFDLDDTLYEYAPCESAGRNAVFQFAGRELGVKSAAFQEAYDNARLSLKARVGETASSHSRLLYCHEALEAIGLRSEPLLALAMEQEFWREYLLSMRLRPGAADLLQLLRFHNVTVAVVTDLTAQIQFRKLAYLDIAKLVDHVVSSEETAHDKVSLEPFRLLFSRLAVEQRESVWFIGDGAHDAPVQQMLDENLIEEGWGFVKDSSSSDRTTGWSSLADIEKTASRIFER